MAPDNTPASIPKDDPFLGAWALVPDRCQYEFGEPPQSGVYQIEASGEGYLVRMK